MTKKSAAGELWDLPFEYEEFLCWWRAANRLHPPLPGSFGLRDGTFWGKIFFAEDRKDTKDGQLIIRFLRKG